MARPGRVVLLGPANQLAACAPPPSTIGIQPLDSAADADRILGELSAAGVDATFILDSPDLTADLLAALPRPTLAWLDAGPAAHAWLTSPAAAAVDRVIAAGHQGAGIWRSLPLPIADALLVEAVTDHVTGTVVQLNPSSPPLGDGYISPSDDELDAALRSHGVALQLGSGGELSHRALRALAAGAVLISEPLAQARGLEPGLDYLELRDHEEIAMLVSETRRAPRALRRLRLRGRAKVETLRASSLIPRVLADLQADVAVFGERHPEPR